MRRPRWTHRRGSNVRSEQLAWDAPPLVVDVRTEAEWDTGHIDDAVNVPLSRLSEQVDVLSRDRRSSCTAQATTARRSPPNSSAAQVFAMCRFWSAGIAAWEAAGRYAGATSGTNRGRQPLLRPAGKRPRLGSTLATTTASEHGASGAERGTD